MATIRKRGSRWQAIVRRNGHPQVSRTFSRKSDAELWARQAESRIERREFEFRIEELRRTTLGNLLTRYLEQVTPKKKGSQTEAYRIKRMLREPLAASSLERLTASDVAEYRDRRLRQVSGPTVRRELAILAHCFEVARIEWAMPLKVNPVAAVAKPKSGKPRERRLDDDDVARIAEGLRHTRNPLVADVIHFALGTGLRRSEILALQWRDFAPQRRAIRIRDSKNGQARLVPLGPKSIALIERQARGKPQDLVFPISSNAIRLAWERLKRRSGVVDLRFHDLRHEAISRFVELGLSVPEVQVLSGHKDPRMVLRYAHAHVGSILEKLSEAEGLKPSDEGAPPQEEQSRLRRSE